MIKKLRKRHNLTQKELAIRCNLSQSYLSKLEDSKRNTDNITLKQIITIAKKLNEDPHKLASWFIDKYLNI